MLRLLYPVIETFTETVESCLDGSVAITTSAGERSRDTNVSRKTLESRVEGSVSGGSKEV